MSDFYIKKGDTAPDLVVTLKNGNGVAVNLTGATVAFRMRHRDSSIAKVDAEATIVTAESGIVQYDFTEEDTDTPGLYYGEFEVTYANADKETFPNKGHIQIEVTENINPLV